MATANFRDQTGFFDPSKNTDTLTVIGCGGIGASSLPTLVTLGIRRIVLWDPDEVEDRNVASQLMFRPDDVGRPKVEVAEEVLTAYGAESVEAHQEPFVSDEHGGALEGIVLSAVDTMAVRQDVWGAVNGNPFVSRLFDGRIGGETYTLIDIDPLNGDHVAWYEKFQLFGDDEVVPLPCTQRAIVYPAVVLGAQVAAAISRHQRGLPGPYFRSVDMLTGHEVVLQ